MAPVRFALVVSAAISLAVSAASGDVFTNKETGETVSGKLLGKAHLQGVELYVVQTDDGARLRLPVAEWLVEAKQQQRGSAWFVQIEVPIEGVGVKEEVIGGLRRAKQQKVALVVMELDTPGGSVELAKEISKAIEDVGGATTVAFIKGGENRGAFSAGALIALACRKIFMADGTSVGAAMPYVLTEKGPEFSEKLTSAFAATFRAMGEKNGWPPAIASAMVDPDVELRQVTLEGKSRFFASQSPSELLTKDGDRGRCIKPKGKLLTLTAREANDLGIASGIVGTRQELLKALGHADAKVVDLRITDTLGPWVVADKLFRALVANWGAAIQSNPASFKYDMVEKVYGGDFDSAGNWQPGYNMWVLADGGRLWRERTDTCLAYIDRCLEVCRQLRKLGGDSPRLDIDQNQVSAWGKALLASRQYLLANRHRTR